MPKFEVVVHRVSVSEQTIIVDAPEGTEDDARAIALEQAGDHEYSEAKAEYVVHSSNRVFTVTDKLRNQILSKLCANGHPDAADLIWLKHPEKLGSQEVEHTGGNCVAYTTYYPFKGENLIVAWTDNGGSDFPTDDDYMVGVYIDSLSGEQLLLIDSETANS